LRITASQDGRMRMGYWEGREGERAKGKGEKAVRR
jgi:hypothetical protein